MAPIMAAPPEPFDEKLFSNPSITAWYLHHFPHSTPMHEDMIHRYIADSPYFDHMTNNGLAMAQANTSQHLFDVSWNRVALEEDLARKRGVEYRIVGAPESVGQAVVVKEDGEVERGGWANTGANGMYVIRKQDRQFVRAPRGGMMQEELTTLGTYYIVGENMYQAPSVGDVVGNRLVAATNSLGKFLQTAKSLAEFDVGRGYVYLPHASSDPHKTKSAHRGGSTTSARSSLAPSPHPSLSREPSIIPGASTAAGAGATDQLSSLRSTSLLPDASSQKPTSSSSDASRLATRLLATSLQLSLEFPSDFTDENPLHGTPGNFSFTHSAAAVKKRRAEDEKLAAAAAREKAARYTGVKAEPGGGANGLKGVLGEKVIASPPAVMTEAKASGAAKEALKAGEAASRRGSKLGERVRRKKSRAVNSVSSLEVLGPVGVVLVRGRVWRGD